ncbi:protocadherin Fat 1-like [Physella acuta]|uniref:protocadherin Fat 1-like n=1 Tax=Physella acuta TaxID=109671 RepID=UPI0027DD473A|nr:protocadherin Fat 1-like [Physella acuta]
MVSSKHIRSSAVVSDGTNSASVTLTLTVTNINDNTPVITVTDVDITIDEEKPSGTSAGFVFSASDADAGTTLVYTLTDATNFNIDSTNGAITLNTKIDVDPAMANVVYHPVLHVSDGTNSASVTLTLTVTNINDNTPVITVTDVDITIDEEKPSGTSAGFVFSASDADAGTTLVYTLTDATNFNIDSTNGAITLNTKIDVDPAMANVVYHPVLHVSDGTNSASVTLTLTVTNINDNTPVITVTDVDITIDEEKPSGTSAGFVFSASDADAGTTLVYTLTDATNFNIDSTNGAITLNTKIDVDPAMANVVYHPVLHVSDGTNSASVTLTLTVTNINDNTPVITVTDVDITIDEEKPSGTSAGFVFSASDADAGTTLVYTLTDATNFNIDSTNGAITLNTKIDVDPAMANVVYHPVLHVSDGTNSASVTLTLTVTNINDNTPVITVTDVDITIDEEKPSGTSAGFVFSASDADAGTTLVYTLTDATNFNIDSTNGAITLNTKIDVDPAMANVVYHPVLHVSDGTNSASVTLTLTVTNINDNTPVITVTDVDITIDEEKPSGTSAGFVFSASDADAGTTLVYTLTDATNFNIDSTNGAITLNTKIDVDPAMANVVYHPVLHVSDGTNSASVTLTLTVTNINDNTPVITVTDVDITIDEEKPSGTSAGFVFSASDADAGTTLVYTLTDATNFNIDSTNGAITLNTKIDVDPAMANVVYHPVLHVSDGTNSASVTLTLTVTNINDNTPVITVTDVDITIDEEKPSGTSAGFVFSASDADAGTTLVYTLTDATNFNIDSTNGAITLNTKIDVDPAMANVVYHPVLHGE